tara:strand:+ start:6418 stop:6714 length:297 start_codon:yes stop_codon:yes gene_type:complete
MKAPAKLTFAVNGLGCIDCVAAIENAVMPLVGVTYVGVSLSSGTMTVRPGPDFDVHAMFSKVRLLGYDIGDDVAGDVARLAGCPCREPSAAGGRTPTQ